MITNEQPKPKKISSGTKNWISKSDFFVILYFGTHMTPCLIWIYSFMRVERDILNADKTNLESRYYWNSYLWILWIHLSVHRSLNFISYTLFHIQDIKKDMRITNCMIYLALSWKRLMIFVIQFQKKNIMCFKGGEYNKMLKRLLLEKEGTWVWSKLLRFFLKSNFFTVESSDKSPATIARWLRCMFTV